MKLSRMITVVGAHAEGEPNEAFWEVYNSESYRPARPDPRGTGTENGNGDILGFR